MLRDLSAARAAYDTGDRAHSVEAHTVPSCETGHEVVTGVWYDMAYSAFDGAVMAVVVLSALHGCQLGLAVHDCVALSLSCVLGVSLAYGARDYVRSKTELDHYNREKSREKWELENYPAGEVKEMVELYVEKGMGAEDAKAVVSMMSKYENFFVDLMMAQELGLPLPATQNPGLHALRNVVSSLLGGLLPIAVFFLSTQLSSYQLKAFLDSLCTPAILISVLLVSVATFSTREFLPKRMGIPFTVLILASAYIVMYSGSQLSAQLSPLVQRMMAGINTHAHSQ
jgi:VIT1/CCC1 family predicted Fe2+/Mn2+ transporter